MTTDDTALSCGVGKTASVRACVVVGGEEWLAYCSESRMSATIMLLSCQHALLFPISMFGKWNIPVEIEEKHDKMETKLDEGFLRVC